jgi:putative spermidine/putrescine transport system substrate-binding protein
LIFWGTGAEGEDLIATGEATMCMEYNSRAIDAKESLGKPVEVQWNQQMLAAAYLTVPKGTPNKDAAMRLIAYIVSPENNGKLSEYFGVAPINMKSEIDPASAENQPSSHLDQAYIIFDDAWIVANQEMVEAFYQEWKSK